MDKQTAEQLQERDVRLKMKIRDAVRPLINEEYKRSGLAVLSIAMESMWVFDGGLGLNTQITYRDEGEDQNRRESIQQQPR